MNRIPAAGGCAPEGVARFTLGILRPGLRTRRLLGVVIVMLTASSTLLAAVTASPGIASAGIGSDRAKVNQLEQLITNQGARVQSLVSRSDRVEGHLAVIEGKISVDQARLVRDIHAQRGATIRLRHVAVDAYISAASGISATVLTSANSTTLPEQQVYVG